MRPRTRHPRLVGLVSTLYRLTLWLYPAEFRHDLGDDLVVTFKNRFEDVLDTGGVRDWLAFAGHTAVDCLWTCGTLMTTTSRAGGSVSLLGLSNDGDRANGGLDGGIVDVSLVFVIVGYVFAVAGWCSYVATLSFYLGCQSTAAGPTIVRILLSFHA